MNFFSHAAVARSFSEDPEFVLGAMLPDFVSMLGARLPEVTHVTLARGVRFHHVTDHVFHDLEVFRMLSRDAHAELRERGLGRGASRAVAHVGIEILLDMTLGQSAPAQAAYLSGLEAGRDTISPHRSRGRRENANGSATCSKRSEAAESCSTRRRRSSWNASNERSRDVRAWRSATTIHRECSIGLSGHALVS
jgi:hypothetical protein